MEVNLNELKPRGIALPLVSVIVPTYNVEKYIGQCLDSIFGNGYPNIEVICVDDRSTDSTVSIIEHYIKSGYDISLFKNDSDHNKFGGWGRNIGLDHAKGKYIHFCDSDDYVKRGLYMECVSRSESLDSDICIFRHTGFHGECEDKSIGNWHICFSDGTMKMDVFKATDMVDAFTVTGLQIWNKFYSFDFIKRNGLRFAEIRNTNDQFFGLSALMLADRIVELDSKNKYYVYRYDTEHSVSKEKNHCGIGVGCVLESFKAVYGTYSSLKEISLSLKRSFERYVLNETRFLSNLKRSDAITAKLVEELKDFVYSKCGIKSNELDCIIKKLEEGRL